MSSSAAFYQILFEHDTLFRTEERRAETPNAVQKSVIQTPEQEKVIVHNTKPVAASAVAQPPVPHQIFPVLQHQILILTDNPKNEKLSDAEHLLLTNILKAVGHATEKTDILNFSFLPSFGANKVLADKRTHFCITFGVPLIKLQLDLLLAPYTPKREEGIWFLLADPLSVIDTDKILKKKLWVALQQMFERS